MRTNRTVLAGVLTLALAIVPTVAAAQTGDEEPSTPSYWTSTYTQGPRFAVPDGEVGYDVWGYRTTMGLTYTAEADDPRASGDISIVFVHDWSTKAELGRGLGLSRLVNEGGSFEGPINVVYYPDGSEFRMALMEGQGGYEGLSYTMTNHLDPSGNGQTQGLIWEGDLPELPNVDMLPE